MPTLCPRSGLSPGSMDFPNLVQLHPVKVNQGRDIPIRVSPTGGGLTLIAYLAQITAIGVDFWIDSGLFLRHGQPLTRETRLFAGETILFKKPPWNEPPAPDEISIIFEDSCLLVLEKPAGIPVTPSGDFFQNSLVNLVRSQEPFKLATPVHRLDQETSGVLVFSKYPAHRSLFQKQFQEQKITKTYQALVWGLVDPGLTTLKGNLGKIPGSPIFSKWGYVQNGGKPCETFISGMEHWKGRTLLSLTPKTGRTNQIRAQLAEAGHPIVGDKKYDPDPNIYLNWVSTRNLEHILHRVQLPHQALHAQNLILEHPLTHASLSLSSGCDAPAAWKTQLEEAGFRT